MKTFDHDKMEAGFYLAGEDTFGNRTFDLRMRKPNSDDLIAPPALHSTEHMLAEAFRTSEAADKVVYVGPMGCRTGFYVLLNKIDFDDALQLTVRCVQNALAMPGVPFSSRKECGACAEHDYAGARRELTKYFALLKNL
ncbi:MAG: S-ribosylhomocysteine lyase [Firmicutes bacterium]|nr:S-ribosylhomocysteine lyase [Bacillota bacterium]